jgi:hypothetical protein
MKSILGLLCATAFVFIGEAGRAAAKPPEVKVLDKLVGRWSPGKASPSDALNAHWTLDDAYLQIDMGFVNNETKRLDALVLLNWDKRKNVYRCWRFGRLDEGLPKQGEGTWIEKDSVLRFTCAPDSDGKRGLVIAFQINGDNLLYTEMYGDSSGGTFQAQLNKRTKE